MKTQKGQAPILILVVVLVLSLVAGGVYYFGKSQAPKPQPQNSVVVSPTPQVTSASSSTPDETANWKTYTNNAYKFSLKYPSNYSVKEQFNSNSRLLLVTITNPTPKPGGGYSQPHVEVVIFKNDANDLKGWLNKHTTTLPFDDPSVSKANSQFFYRGVTNQKEVLLGGKQAITFESILFESSPNPTLTVLDSYIIGLVLDNTNETKDPSLKEIYPQILSTFKFTQ